MKPILFNTEMVKAILDGRKTVTRRCVKRDIVLNQEQGQIFIYDKRYLFDFVPDAYINSQARYKKGDFLYVRETFGSQIRHGGEFLVYKANEHNAMNYDVNAKGSYPTSKVKWKPSIHMPKEAARIFLRVTDVRIERLQDITEEQAIKEGLHEYTKDGVVVKYAVNETAFAWSEMPRTATEAFYHLWNSTLKQDELDQYGWDANPYVFVYEFEVISKDEAYLEGEKS